MIAECIGSRMYLKKTSSQIESYIEKYGCEIGCQPQNHLEGCVVDDRLDRLRNSRVFDSLLNYYNMMSSYVRK